MISKPYGARKSSPPRSIPPSLRDTYRNPLDIRIHPVDESQFDISNGIEGSQAVMAVTLARDGGYSNRFCLDAYFDLYGEVQNAKG